VRLRASNQADVEGTTNIMITTVRRETPSELEAQIIGYYTLVMSDIAHGRDDDAAKENAIALIRAGRCKGEVVTIGFALWLGLSPDGRSILTASNYSDFI
jgi:hypothetical protein